MQFLKVLVIIMGVLIIAGFAVLGVVLYKRMSDPERRVESAERVTVPDAKPDEVGLSLPPGTRMGDPVAVGNRVLFRVTVPNGDDRLYVMDPRTGAIAFSVTTGAVPTGGKAAAQ